MANFCTKCGKKLEQGAKCTCEKIKKENDIKDNVKNSDLLNMISNFIKKPYNSLNSINLGDFKYLIICLSSLSLGLISSLFIWTRYINYFFTVSILSFIIFILFGVILSLTTNSIFKEKLEFNDALDLVSLSSIHLFIGNICAFIFAFLSYKLSIIIVMLSSLLFILNIQNGINIKTNIDKNKTNYVVVICIVITYLISSLLFRIF